MFAIEETHFTMFERFQCLKYCNELYAPSDSNLNVMKTQCSLDTLQMGGLRTIAVTVTLAFLGIMTQSFLHKHNIFCSDRSSIRRCSRTTCLLPHCPFNLHMHLKNLEHLSNSVPVLLNRSIGVLCSKGAINVRFVWDPGILMSSTWDNEKNSSSYEFW